ncbi:zinc finger BED domain-containing protein RICESLEEPER 4-like [Apium graveolens]|uniref:zinc finger BED domain-containing protein RICESLEEPER 4-like n=1 Tax=Apium graveolens TaxID=4045 RepID=UPI003D796B1F
MEVGSGISEKKVEWEKYLEDECESNESCPNVLQWWKDNKHIYPTLAKLASDVLPIPVSTVALESAFSSGCRVLDSFRTSLTPRMVEALICAQDWLRTTKQPFIVEESLLKLEKLEGMENLTIEQPVILID